MTNPAHAECLRANERLFWQTSRAKGQFSNLFDRFMVFRFFGNNDVVVYEVHFLDPGRDDVRPVILVMTGQDYFLSRASRIIRRRRELPVKII